MSANRECGKRLCDEGGGDVEAPAPSTESNVSLDIFGRTIDFSERGLAVEFALANNGEHPIQDIRAESGGQSGAHCNSVSRGGLAAGEVRNLLIWCDNPLYNVGGAFRVQLFVEYNQFGSSRSVQSEASFNVNPRGEVPGATLAVHPRTISASEGGLAVEFTLRNPSQYPLTGISARSGNSSSTNCNVMRLGEVQPNSERRMSIWCDNARRYVGGDFGVRIAVSYSQVGSNQSVEEGTTITVSPPAEEGPGPGPSPTPSPSPTQTPAPTSGDWVIQVISAVTKLPVPGATVTIYGRGSMVANGKGFVRFTNLPFGKYSGSVDAPGWQTINGASADFDGRSLVVELKPVR